MLTVAWHTLPYRYDLHARANTHLRTYTHIYFFFTPTLLKSQDLEIFKNRTEKWFKIPVTNSSCERRKFFEPTYVCVYSGIGIYSNI